MTSNDANLFGRRDLNAHVLCLFKTHYILCTQERRKLCIFNLYTVCMYEAEAIETEIQHRGKGTCELAIGCRKHHAC